MIYKLLTYILFTLFFAANGFAQTTGHIVTTDGVPLPNVRVYALNTLYVTESDSMGSFSLSLPAGKYVLEVTLNGYVTQIDTVLADETVTIVLIRGGQQLEEVVVNAGKREETTVNTAMSVTVLTGKQITDTRTWEIGQLVGLIPNFQYGNLGVSYQQQIAIRGVSVFSETPAVATYIDGVNALDVGANGLQLLDIERVEILRGPQGTLYGRNAMGGVIRIETKQPSDKLSAMGEVSLGNQGLQRYGWAVKTPLIQKKLFLGVAGNYQYQNGFYTNDLTGKSGFLHEPLTGTPEDGVRMGDETSVYGNLFLNWLPSSKIKLVLNTKLQEDRSKGASAYYQAVLNEKEAFDHPYTLAVDRLGSNRRMVSNTSVGLTRDFRKFRLFANAAFQYVAQVYDGVDQDLYPYDLARGYSYHNKPGDATPMRVFSQEVRLASPGNSKKLSWTAGIYSFQQNYDKRYATLYEQLALFFGIQPGLEVFRTDQRNNGVAGFANSEYKLTTKWAVTAGLRADYEQRTTVVARYYQHDDGSRTYSIRDTMLSSQFHALSPKVGIRFIPSINNQWYATYSRGFRAGGNNMFTGGSYPTYLPEYSNNWEAGYKFQGKQKRIMLATCFFLLDWRQMQLDMQPEPGVWIVANVGHMRAVGGEAELTALPFKGTEVTAALGVNDARYGDFFYLGKNIRGNRGIMSPAYTLTTAVQQLVPLKKGYLLSGRVEFRSIGKQYFDLINTLGQDAYGLLNLRAGVKKGPFSCFAWVQNITATTYITYAMPGYFRYTLLNRPRSFGLTLNYQF